MLKNLGMFLAGGIAFSALIAGCSGPEQEPSTEPKPHAEAEDPAGPRVTVPMSNRSLRDHVNAIQAQVPRGDSAPDHAIVLHHSVNEDRRLDWGAEGAYWTVVQSFMEASGLVVVDTWAQCVHLGVGPSGFVAVTTSAGCLLGYWRRSAPGAEPVRIEPAVIGPYWKDLTGWTFPEVSADPPIEMEPYATVIPVPEGTRSLSVAWKLLTRIRKTSMDFPLDIGRRQAVPGTEGAVTIDGIRDLPSGLLGVSWTPENLVLSGNELVLEDGTSLEVRSGQGWYASGERQFDAPKSKPSALRLGIVLEQRREPLKLELDPSRLRQPPERPRPPLAGTVRWAVEPAGKVLLEMGIIRRSGWQPPVQMFLKFGNETTAVPEFVPADHRNVQMRFQPGRTVDYEVLGLDSGSYTLWVRAENWIESLPFAVPGRDGRADFTVEGRASAGIRVLAPGGSEPLLRPAPAEGEEPLLADVESLRVFLGKGDDETFVAKGLKPGRYVLHCGRKSRTVVLSAGWTEVDCR